MLSRSIRCLPQVSLSLLVGLCCFAAGCSAGSPPAPSKPAVYATSDEALVALVTAFKSEDPNQLIAIYGKDGREFVVTGDPAADKLFMRRMGQKFEQRAELISVNSQEYSGERWYKVRFGTEGWNMRIPLVNRGNGWLFATEHGAEAAKEARREMNEITAVDTLLTLIKAENEYRQTDWTGTGKQYAQRIMSSPGKKDGLYWPAAPGQPASPLDAVVARAFEDGYRKSGDKQTAYEGYFYRVLTAMGRSSKAGKMSFLDNGKMTRGFAFIACPVKWGVSGNNTFLVSVDGKIYKKDLGIRTDSICEETTEMNPDQTWSWIDHRNLGGSNSRLNW